MENHVVKGKFLLNDLVEMKNPMLVLKEVKHIVSEMFTGFNFELLDAVFEDTVRLFRGDYPGFQPCDTEYHDLKHTTDTLLAMTRLIHGGALDGLRFSKKGVLLGLISAMFHDSGYILTLEESGPGAQHTLIHIDRSIHFLRRYFLKSGYSSNDMDACDLILKCTGLNVNIPQIHFRSTQNEILGKMLGTADLLGQMADRNYLEKLPFLYREFKEAGIEGLGTELDFLDNTPGFYEMTRERMVHDLGGVAVHMRGHFRERWHVDEDLYEIAIEKNIDYLKYILKNHREDVHARLRRSGLMLKLQQRFP
jgi:hypothetical protein